MKAGKLLSKFCSKCQRTLPVSSFYVRAKNPDGYRYHCIECEREAKQRFRKGKKTKYKPRKRNRRKNLTLKDLSRLSRLDLIKFYAAKYQNLQQPIEEIKEPDFSYLEKWFGLVKGVDYIIKKGKITDNEVAVPPFCNSPF